MCEGYFKVWRELFDKPIWLNSSPEHKTILFTLLKMANWKKGQGEWKGKQYYCEPGEFITSIGKIQTAAGKGISRQNIRSGLNRLKNLEFLTYQSTDGWGNGIKVIINNWGKYQPETNRPSNRLPTPIEEGKNNYSNTSYIIVSLSIEERELLEKYLLKQKRKTPIDDIDAYISTLAKNGDLENKLIKAKKWQERQQEKQNETKQKLEEKSEISINTEEDEQKAREVYLEKTKHLRRRRANNVTTHQSMAAPA